MQTRNHISPADRLGMTLVLAVGLHVLLILGVSFNLQDDSRPDNISTTLDITIVHTHSDEENPDAEFLAQSNQRGGGISEESVVPRNPNFNPLPLPEYGEDMQSHNEEIPQSRKEPRESDVLSAEKSPLKLRLMPNNTLITENLEGMSQELQRITMEYDSTNAAIDQTRSELAQKREERYASANTRYDVTAVYGDTIRDQILRIGTLNYPDEARRRNLSGTVHLDIVILPSGKVAGIYILRSSGHKVLDDAAVRIAEIAASNFPPFPDSMKESTSIYHFDRIWVFENGKIRTGQ